MKTAVLVLYVVAFILQMLGAYGVIQDVRASIGNMRRLKSDLAQAEATAEEHRRSIATIRDRPRPFGLDRAMASLADAIGEAAVNRPGPPQQSSAERY